MFTEYAKTSIDHAIRRVRQFRASKGWKLNTFAKAVGLRESTLRRMDSPDWRPELETLEKLERFVAEQELR